MVSDCELFTEKLQLHGRVNDEKHSISACAQAIIVRREAYRLGDT